MKVSEKRHASGRRLSTNQRRLRGAEKPPSVADRGTGCPRGCKTTDPESEDNCALGLDDFIFLSDSNSCRLIRTSDIWFLEAAGEQTRVHAADGNVRTKRPLHECEKRLDRATFFRATRDYVINLTHVKQTRLLDASRVLFVLPTGQEVIVSGPQNALFRKMRAL